ncbi:putative protein RP812 [Commensalibacter sp. Nvir]|uniref:BolA/IbaG family iron-sulfur metabolism protein n=1 Tax=Commensalibacter sp. Nvir TaxID=3069817 RepID=UPI002D4AAF4C|nr:putative protein RP812 [Commensalibacter sp. Nvir]
MNIPQIEERLQSSFPTAVIKVGALKDDGRHFYCKIAAKEFVGLSKLQQHQLVYKVLWDYMKDDLHALALQTEELN